MLGPISATVLVSPVFLSEHLGNIGCNGIDNGSDIRLVKTIMQSPRGDFMRIEQTFISRLDLVSLDVVFHLVGIGGHLRNTS